MPDEHKSPAAVPFAQACRFWLKLGFISFGGPAGQIAIMHQELVEQRRWISSQRFLHALNYCMVLPGPEAQPLATYIGWLMHRTAGGLVAGGLFVLPTLLILIGLSWVYLAFGELPAVAAILYGIKPAVTVIVLAAAWRIGRRTLHNPLLQALAVVALLAIALLDAPFPLIIAGAALIGWLGAGQMIDGLALGETTPGPLIMVVAFAGFVGGWGAELFGPERLFLALTTSLGLAAP